MNPPPPPAPAEKNRRSSVGQLQTRVRMAPAQRPGLTRVHMAPAQRPGLTRAAVGARSPGGDLLHHGGQVDAGTRLSMSQLEHQLLLFLRERLVDRHLPLQRPLQVQLLLGQLPAEQKWRWSYSPGGVPELLRSLRETFGLENATKAEPQNQLRTTY